MKKVYLFITVLLALIISYSMAATYTATEQDKTNVNAYVNKVSTLIDSKLKKTPTNKQATVVQSTLKSLRFVGKGSAARNAALTEMAKDQIQSQYSDILKNTTTTTTTPTKTPIKKTNTNALDKFGDINSDGLKFRNSDTISLMRYVGGQRLNIPTDFLERADYDLNGVVNNTDLCIHTKYAIGQITTLPYVHTSPDTCPLPVGLQENTSSCLGNIPSHAHDNSTSKLSTQTRNQNTIGGLCTFECDAGYGYDGDACNLQASMINVQTQNVSTNSFEVKYTCKNTNGNLGDKYEIAFLSAQGTVTSSREIQPTTYNGTECLSTIDNLTPNTNYIYKIRIYNNNLVTNTSNATMVKTLNTSSLGSNFDLRGDFIFLQHPAGTYIYTRIFNTGTDSTPNATAKIYIDNTLFKTYNINPLPRGGYTTFEDNYGVITPGATVGQHTAKVEVTPTDNNPSNNITTKTFNLILPNYDLSVDSILVSPISNGQYKLQTTIKRSNLVLPSPYNIKIYMDNNIIMDENKETNLINAQSRQSSIVYKDINLSAGQHTVKVSITSIIGNDNNLTNNEKEYSFNTNSIDLKSDLKINDLITQERGTTDSEGKQKIAITPIIVKGNGTSPTRPFKYKIFLDDTQVFESYEQSPLTQSSAIYSLAYNAVLIPGTTHTVKVQVNAIGGIDPDLNNNEMTKTFTMANAPTVTPRKPIVMQAVNIQKNTLPTSFEAARQIPQNGGVVYQLDVSTNQNFTSFVAGYQNKNVDINRGKQAVSGLEKTTYYYRLRTKTIVGNNYGPYSDTATVNLEETEVSDLSNLKLKNMYIDLSYGTNIINSSTTNFYKRGPVYDNFLPGFMRFGLKNEGNIAIQVGPSISINCKIFNENNIEIYNRTSTISLGGSNNTINAGSTITQAFGLSSSTIQKLTELGNKKVSCGISNIEGRRLSNEGFSLTYTTKYRSSLVNFPAVAFSYNPGYGMKYYDTNNQSWIDSSPMIYTQTAPLTAAKALAVCKQKYPNTTKTTYRDISMIQGVTFKKLGTTVQENITANIFKCIE